MSVEDIFGMILMAVCCFGCGILCLALGSYAQRSDKPFGFWAGKEIEARWVSDIAAYNRENGRMWKVYSIPYFLSGFLGCLNPIHEGFMVASAVLLVLAAVPGLFLLIRHYRKIEKKYIDPKRLDKIDPFC